MLSMPGNSPIVSSLPGRCAMQGSQLVSGSEAKASVPSRLPAIVPSRRVQQVDQVVAPSRAGINYRTGVSLTEVAGIWLVAAIWTLGILVTYSWVSPADLYHVSRDGLAGGAGRALVHLNFPLAFAAIALAGFAWARIAAVPDALSPVARRLLAGLTLVAVGLCLVAAVPGVVEQGDLDAKPVNIVPAIGVLLALAVTAVAVRATGWGMPAVWRPAANWVALAIAGVLVVLSLPWILADFGMYIGDVPLLGRLFMSKEIPAGHELRAVHLGHHHGLDGTFFALTALALLRPFGQLAAGWLRGVLAVVVSLLFVYGIANFFEDFWGEQIEKHGWASFDILPNVTRPELNLAWGAMLVAIVSVAGVLVRRPASREMAADAA
jgi:hypothetical protein